jgi:ABC-type branched-subunit amino acid transport system ATPase component/branched-subunit amino acid ABC-type transport system permease component
MHEVIRFGLLGFGLGALYSLASQGLIVVYRGSGVVNFAQGAIGTVGAYIAWSEMHVNAGAPLWVGLIVGVAACAGLGALTHIVVMRPLRHASPLARVVATLGVLVTLQSLATIRYGLNSQFPASVLPQTVYHPFGFIIPIDRFILLAIALALSIGLWLLYKYTWFGLATTAVASSERSASTLAISPDAIATMNWALGCGLAGLATILVAPIVQLQVSVMTQLVLAAMAAALVAGFRSFPIAFVAGMLIGIAQTELNRYAVPHSWGVGFDQAVPFVVIVIVLIVRGQALPLRDYFLQRLPSVGSGRVQPLLVGLGAVGGSVLMFLLTGDWALAFVSTLSAAVVILSIVLLTGYAGQISLAQFALAGFGAWVTGRLVGAVGIPFGFAALIGILATIPLGVVFAIPAVRTRGINLAIVTLGLGSAVELVLFDNGKYTGGYFGTNVGAPHLFGMNFDPVLHTNRYAFLCLVCFIVLALMIANVRRGRSGRRLLAVRTNERAAAALGINVPGAKLYAFGLSAAIAAVGGILIAWQTSTITYSATFPNFNSILYVGWAFIGGIGYLIGPLIGGTLSDGGVGTQLGNSLHIPDWSKYVQLVGGVSVILLVLQNQNGIVPQTIKQARWLAAKLRIPNLPTPPLPRLLRGSSLAPRLSGGKQTKVEPKTLEVRDLSVSYGAVTAVNDMSLVVSPGEVVGLIGPNGAGKTSLIDAVTGFTSASGSVLLDGEDVSRVPVVARARRGLIRSFQSLELFEDATVLDNLRVASDPRDLGSYVRDLVAPVAPPLPPVVATAIREFDLESDLLLRVEELPYGKRRLLAMARAVASNPSVLLLDEPVAGLSEHESAELVDLVRRLAHEWGIAVLLVEHDMNFVMNVCDRICVMDFGLKISEGTPEQVRSDPIVIKAYLGDDDSSETAAATTKPGAAATSGE